MTIETTVQAAITTEVANLNQRIMSTFKLLHDFFGETEELQERFFVSNFDDTTALAGIASREAAAAVLLKEFKRVFGVNWNQDKFIERLELDQGEINGLPHGQFFKTGDSFIGEIDGESIRFYEVFVLTSKAKLMTTKLVEAAR